MSHVKPQQRRDDPAPEAPGGLRRVAVASLAALAVVLPLGAATAGPQRVARHDNARSLTTGDASATGLFKR